MLPSTMKIVSYRLNSHEFPDSVNIRGLFLLLLLGGDIAVNPSPVMGLLKVRSMRNKGAIICIQNMDTKFGFAMSNGDSHTSFRH